MVGWGDNKKAQHVRVGVIYSNIFFWGGGVSRGISNRETQFVRVRSDIHVC